MRDLIEKIRRREEVPAQLVRLPDGHAWRADQSAVATKPELTPAAGYFSVAVNSMKLGFAGQGAKNFDPLVLAVTELVYNGKPREVPFVVAGSMVNAPDGTPRGMVLADTTVAGPHPYNGGVAVTVVLYRVVRDNYLRKLLDTVQRTCAAFDLTGALSTYLKVGEALLDGLDAVLGDDGTTPVLGYRAAFDRTLAPGTFAVLPTSLPAKELWLEGGELRQGATQADATSLAKTDCLTFSVSPAPLVDLDALPWFQPLWNRVTQWANIPSDTAKDVAKNYLAAIYEEILTSPDVARDTAEELYRSWDDRARTIHEVANERKRWGPAELLADPVRARVLEIRGSS